MNDRRKMYGKADAQSLNTSSLPRMPVSKQGGTVLNSSYHHGLPPRSKQSQRPQMKAQSSVGGLGFSAAEIGSMGLATDAYNNLPSNAPKGPRYAKKAEL